MDPAVWHRRRAARARRGDQRSRRQQPPRAAGPRAAQPQAQPAGPRCRASGRAEGPGAQADRRGIRARGVRAVAVPDPARSGDQAGGDGRRPGGGRRREDASGIHPGGADARRRRAGEVAGCRVAGGRGPPRPAHRHPRRPGRWLRDREPHREHLGPVGSRPPRLRRTGAMARLGLAEIPARGEAPVQVAGRNRPRARRDRLRHLARRLAAPSWQQGGQSRRADVLLPGRDAARARPESARARDRGAEPGDGGVVPAAARRRADDAAGSGLARGLAGHRGAARPRTGAHGDPGRHRRRRGARRAELAPGCAGRGDRREGLHRDRPRGEPRLAEAAAGGPLRPARHAQDPPEQDRLLDGCGEPHRPAGAASPPIPRAAAAAPGRHQDPADRGDAGEEHRRRRARAHHL